MTSHSARTMREVSETVNIYSIYIYFWCKSLGRVTSKVENLVFYKHKTGVLFVEGSRVLPKSSCFPFNHKVVQDIAFYALAPDCSIQVLPFFCPTVCLKSVFRPKKNSFFVGFLPKCFTNSPRLWATFCNFRRFSGTCCLEAPFQALQPSA